jgi:hypothetical protein
VLWLDHGRLIADADVGEVTRAYHEWSGTTGVGAEEFAGTLGIAPRLAAETK